MFTHFTFLDAGIVGFYLLLTIIAGLAVRKYVGKVEHYLVAGREMNLYLGIASLAATEFGIVTCMYTAQNGFKMGFAGATPGILQTIAMLVVGITGFCIKPLRDAGVMTIPELFEKRFGPTIRWLAGVVIVLGGLLNMGVFLRTGGEFLLLTAGFDPQAFAQSYHLEIMMTILLVIVALYTVLGGMLSVLVTDFLQFIIMSLSMLVVTVLIFAKIGWTPLVEAVQKHHGPAGFNPFLMERGWEFVLFNLCLQFAVVLTWQAVIQRILSAKSTKTGKQIYMHTSFFFTARFLIPGLWGIAALATLAPEQIGGNTLYAMPKFLSTFLPTGLMGILIAGMLAADMSTDSAYMLTWGGVIYNDILAPFRRKKQWSEKKGVLINRFIVGCIGMFLLFYGLWYPLKGNLWDYLGVTGTIYLSSMSVLLIACCYWKDANNWGAMGAIILGALFPIGFLVLQQLPATAEWAQHVGPYKSGIASYIASGTAMIIGSLLKKFLVKKKEPSY